MANMLCSMCSTPMSYSISSVALIVQKVQMKQMKSDDVQFQFISDENIVQLYTIKWNKNKTYGTDFTKEHT